MRELSHVINFFESEACITLEHGGSVTGKILGGGTRVAAHSVAVESGPFDFQINGPGFSSLKI